MNTKVLSIVLSIIFLASGGAKLAGLDFEIAAFTRWSYPLWFMYFTGVIEVAGAIGLLVRRLSALASAGLALVMTGAVATHVLHAEWLMMIVAFGIFGLAVTRAWLGRADIQALAGRN